MSDTNLYAPNTSTAFVNIKPSYTMTFSNDTGVVGKLDFNGPVLVFTGDADESAKRFIGAVEQLFHGRMQWVGLTDFELGGLSVSPELRHIETSLLVKYVRRIEAKLKEKNGGI